MIKYGKDQHPAKHRKEAGVDPLLVTIKNWHENSKGWVGTWESNQEKWHKMRMRIKKEKTFPFPNCSNLRMPTIEIKMRKLKSALMNVIFGIRPIVQVIPDPSGNWESARKIEKWLDHLMMDKMGLKNKALIGIDQTIEKGFYLLKPYWRLETTTRVEELSLDDLSLDEVLWLFDERRTADEVMQAVIQRTQADMNGYVRKENTQALQEAIIKIMSGVPEIKIELEDIIYNLPDVDLVPPERCYVPTTTGYDPQGAEYIIHEFFIPLHKLKQRVQAGRGYNKSAIKDIHDKKDINLNSKSIDVTKNEREGIERLQKGTSLVKVWEVYCWYDINGDDTPEKCVITVAPNFDKVLRKVTLPHYSGKYPFVKLFYELTDDRWFSHRGIPELVEDIAKEIDIQHMQKIDSQTIRNAPIFMHRAGMVNPNVMQFVFGQSIPVQGLQPFDEIIQPINNVNTNAEYSYEREQMILETKVEEMIGQVDFTLQSMINRREPRTATEASMQVQNMQQVFSLDSDMFRGQFEDLFNLVYELWSMYGNEQEAFSYFGPDGYEQIKLSKEEIQGKYKITVRGNDQNTNPQVKMQKAQMILQSMENEAALNSGVITPVHLANAYKRFYQQLDIPNWDELVSKPEMVARMMKAQQQQPQSSSIQVQFQELTPAEQAQVIQGYGIKPDMQGRGGREARDIGKEASEISEKIASTQDKLESKRREGYE